MFQEPVEQLPLGFSIAEEKNQDSFKNQTGYIQIYATELLMNWATSIPKSVLHLVLDKDRNSGLEFNFFCRPEVA